MLHVAPEPFFAQRFDAVPNLDYLSADLLRPNAMVKMDITDIQYPDASFSVIYCSHVLEHVPDDRKAIGEFFRVLRPGGWALLNVPISGETTYEDPSITDPAEREKHFGQWNHVRVCGRDYIERMRNAGFDAETLRGRDLATESECRRIGFGMNNQLQFCKKPA